VVAFFMKGDCMKKIRLFTVDDSYIDYLRQYGTKVLKHSGEDYVTSI